MATIRLKAIDMTNPALDTVSRKVDALGGKDLTIYLKSSAGTTAGAVQLEGSPTGSLAAEPSTADWAAISTPLAFTAGATVSKSAVEAHRYVRVRVSTGFVGGSGASTVYLVVGGKTDGAWQDV